MESVKVTGKALNGVIAAGFLLACAGTVVAQNCTTQSKLSVDARSGLSDAGLTLGTQVKAGNAAALQASAIAEYASNFGSTQTLVADTAAKLSGDSLKVTQVYLLDGRNRKAGDNSDADFSCGFSGVRGETDFSISGLPPGLYGFLMVEASGDKPWLLSFLVRQEGGKWKLAGFYPHARLAAGHDGLWFWKSARDDAKANEPWVSWLMYGQADELLRPANFATSSNLDTLRTEQRSVAPSGLADGIGQQTPLVVKGAGGAEFRFTGIGSAGSDDGKRLNLVLHLQGEPDVTIATAESARNTAAASAMLNAYKELRAGFDGVTVIAETSGRAPFVTQQPISEIH
jgi:hypothetical protein